MIAIARLIAHAIICAAGVTATIEFVFLKQEARGMDKYYFHLITYIIAGEDMVDAAPLTFVTISTTHAILSTGIL